jgi:acyl-CoA synthetase (AMP-forming)/AMP-acid ligase II/acyl carrier protein
MNPSTLVEILRWRALHQTDQIAYTFLLNGEKEGPHLTYGELDRRARAIAALLQSYGARGERVLLLYQPGLEFITAFFGCLYAGAIAVPAYPPRKKHQTSRIPAIVEDAQAAFVLTTENINAKIHSWFTQTSDLSSLKILTTDTIIDEVAEDWQEPDVRSHDVAFLQYTSGSTATPKGVMVTHANLLHNLALIQEKFNHTSESRGVIWLPLYHDMGLIGGVLQPLFVGFPVFLMSPAAFLQRPIRWLQAISRYRATTSGGPNFAYELCVNCISCEQRETLDLSSWEVAFSGAEPVRHDILEHFAAAFAFCGFRQEAFYPCYGLAESTLFVSGGHKTTPPVIRAFQESTLKYNNVLETAKDDNDARVLVGCGSPPPDKMIRIVDPESLSRCEPDQIGEIWVAGPDVAQGYWNRPEETTRTFRAFLDDTGEGPFLRTGDLGFFRDGELFITGRLKDLIIIRGRNHYPDDIEWGVTQSSPLIRPHSCAAFSITIAGEEQLVVAAEINPRFKDRRKSGKHSYRGPERRRISDRSLNVETAIENIRHIIAEHHGLQVYAVVLLKAGTIPKTSSGKIQRRACKAAFLDGNLDVVTGSTLKGVEVKECKDCLDPETLLSHPPQQRQTVLESYLRGLVASVLHIDHVFVDRQQHLSHLGIDSLMALELRNRMTTELGVEVTTEKFIDGITIAQLAELVLDQLVLASLVLSEPLAEELNENMEEIAI